MKRHHRNANKKMDKNSRKQIRLDSTNPKEENFSDRFITTPTIIAICGATGSGKTRILSKINLWPKEFHIKLKPDDHQRHLTIVIGRFISANSTENHQWKNYKDFARGIGSTYLTATSISDLRSICSAKSEKEFIKRFFDLITQILSKVQENPEKIYSLPNFLHGTAPTIEETQNSAIALASLVQEDEELASDEEDFPIRSNMTVTLILDDLQSSLIGQSAECERGLMTLFANHSHHNNTNIIYLSQYPFKSISSTITQARVMIVTSNNEPARMTLQHYSSKLMPDAYDFYIKTHVPAAICIIPSIRFIGKIEF